MFRDIENKERSTTQFLLMLQKFRAEAGFSLGRYLSLTLKLSFNSNPNSTTAEVVSRW
jgi:hypothetical protein